MQLRRFRVRYQDDILVAHLDCLGVEIAFGFRQADLVEDGHKVRRRRIVGFEVGGFQELLGDRPRLKSERSTKDE